MWGLTSKDFYKLSVIDYNKLWASNLYKDSYKSNEFRYLVSVIMNYSGMGLKKPAMPSDVFNVPLIDSEDVLLPIDTQQKADNLLKELLA